MENKKLSFSIYKPKTRCTPRMVEVAREGGEYVLYGTDNKFPDFLWDLYLKSPIMSSIINGTADFIYGGGINFSDKISIPSDFINEDGDTLEDVIKKVIIDHQLFGGFALKVLRNSLNQVCEIRWVDFRNVRVNEDESVATIFPKGLKYYGKKETYPIFDNTTDYMTSIYYFKGHITRGVYPIVKYAGALAAIETSTEISKFHLNAIRNNFSGNFIINYNNTDFTEEQKGEIKKGIEENFTGSENAGKFMLAFNQGKDNAVTVARIPEDQFDKKYDALNKSTMKDIFIAFRAQPQLFGFVIEGSVFNKNEFAEAYSLYDKAVVKPAQTDIQRILDKIFGVENSIGFNNYRLED